MGVHQNLTGAQRAARYRAAKRAQGLRLKQIWVPDLRNPKVRDRFRREGKEINRRDRKSGIMAELDAMADDLMATLPPYGDKEDQLAALLADLDRKGSATYLAEFPMHDADGTHVATGRVTVKLLSHGWTKAA